MILAPCTANHLHSQLPLWGPAPNWHTHHPSPIPLALPTALHMAVVPAVVSSAQPVPSSSRIHCWQLRVTAVQAQGGTHSWMMQHSPLVLQAFHQHMRTHNQAYTWAERAQWPKKQQKRLQHVVEMQLKQIPEANNVWQQWGRFAA